MLAAQRSSMIASTRAQRSSTVLVRASGDSHSTGKYQPGMKIKVTAPIRLFSVPKHPEGLIIEGLQGEVFKDVSEYKGKVLSAGLPILCKFSKEFEGKEVKFQAHLVREGAGKAAGSSDQGTLSVGGRGPSPMLTPPPLDHAGRGRD